MNPDKRYFFCGVGGSGMAPLALILRAQGAEIAGSDRALDQGRTPAKFDYLRSHGLVLSPQDGSGLTSADQILVVSGAVEDTVPDVQAAKRLGARIVTRAELLAEQFNAAPTSVGVAGTSGKSTTTAMIAWILHQSGRDPTVMNGAVMKNFVTPEAPFASALVGQGGVFVSEVDESDGSIARYKPTVAVINNIALDHKSMEELRALFGGFAGRARRAILNLDNAETAHLASTAANPVTFSLKDAGAAYVASDLEPFPGAVGFTVTETANGETARIRLPAPGAHNVANALAAIAAVRELGVSLSEASAALDRFAGVKRRLEMVGEARGVTVIDDFAHNPDKIAATLSTLHAFPGRLLVMFQPHGFGPLRLMKTEFIEGLAAGLTPDDVLLMPEPVYFGGTVDRSVGSRDIVSGLVDRGRKAEALADREACGARLLELAAPGDRIVVMGARDDTLSVFAEDLVRSLAAS